MRYKWLYNIGEFPEDHLIKQSSVYLRFIKGTLMQI